MRVHYFNDEKKEMMVRTIDQKGNNEFHHVAPHTGKTFIIDVPLNRLTIPFIKRWETVVLISYMIVENNDGTDIKID